ncbi:hypothetical protein B0H16DRAFT_1499871 [Mycena metata]|uniref:Secreted protein n=1 Tax=Mycena metata TaxID=1033252 RepID=A0AAD7NY42_9AGAR|nr:hypothetical protein B0H16DRAFT_1499871 [Mycena metata]
MVTWHRVITLSVRGPTASLFLCTWGRLQFCPSLYTSSGNLPGASICALCSSKPTCQASTPRPTLACSPSIQLRTTFKNTAAKPSSLTGLQDWRAVSCCWAYRVLR